MANSKVPVATMIPLISMDDEEFYAVITHKEVSESGMWE